MRNFLFKLGGWLLIMSAVWLFFCIINWDWNPGHWGVLSRLGLAIGSISAYNHVENY